MKAGTKVRIKDNVKGDFASTFIGQVGEVISKCKLHKNAHVVHFNSVPWSEYSWDASYRKNEMEVIEYENPKVAYFN